MMKNLFTIKLKLLLQWVDRDFELSRQQMALVIFLFLLVGFGLRLGYWFMRERPPQDEKAYIECIERIKSNQKPLKPTTLMVLIGSHVSRLGISPEITLRFMNLGYALLWLVVMYFLCRDAFDNDKAGLLGMAFATFNPYSVRMACQIMREPLYILIFTLSLWCVVRLIKSKKYSLYPIGLGILTVLGAGTRYEGFEITFFLPLGMIVLLAQYKTKYIKRCIINCVMYFLVVTLFIGVLYYFDVNLIYRAESKTINYIHVITGKEWE